MGLGGSTGYRRTASDRYRSRAIWRIHPAGNFGSLTTRTYPNQRSAHALSPDGHTDSYPDVKETREQLPLPPDSDAAPADGACGRGLPCAPATG